MKENLVDIYQELTENEMDYILEKMCKWKRKDFNLGMLPFFDTLTVLEALRSAATTKQSMIIRNFLFSKLVKYYVDKEVTVEVKDNPLRIRVFISNSKLRGKYEELCSCSWVQVRPQFNTTDDEEKLRKYFEDVYKLTQLDKSAWVKIKADKKINWWKNLITK